MATITELLVKLGVDADEIEDMGSKLGPIAKAGGVAVGAAITAGAVIGVQQDAVGDKLAAQLRLSEGESEKAGEIAGGLYADAYGDSFEHVNDAVGAVIGTLTDDLADTSAIEDLSAKALDLASAFDLDVTEAVSRAGVLMKTGLAKDADEAMDLVAASMQEVAPGLRDELGEATTEYSKFFADLGFTGEEMFGLLAAADDKFALDKTGDAIKELSIRATDMSALSVEAFDTMGLDAETMANRILEGGDTAKGAFDEIVDGLLSMDNPAAQANTAIALFGTPIEDLSAAQIPEFLESLQGMEGGMQDVAGRADELGDTLNDNAKTTIEGFKRSFEQLLTKVLDLPGPLGGVATAVAGVGAVIAPVGPAIGGLALLFKGNMASIASSAAAGFASIRTGFMAMSTMLLTNPFVAITAAVIAVVTLIVLNWDKVKAVTKRVWGAVKKFVEKWWPLLLAVVTGGLSLIIGAVVKNWDKIKATTAAVWNNIKEFFKRFWPIILGIFTGGLSLIVGLLVKNWDKIWRGVQDMWGRVRDFFRDLPGRILGFLAGFGTLLLRKGKDLLTGLWNGVKAVWNSTATWLGNLGTRAVSAIGGVLSTLVNKGRDLLDGLWTGAKQIWGTAAGWLGSLPGLAVDAVGNLGSILYNIGKAVIGGLWDGMKAVWHSVTGWLKDIGGKIVGFIKNPLGIFSPSKVMMTLGEQTMEGFRLGLESGFDGVEMAMGAHVVGIRGAVAAAAPGDMVTAADENPSGRGGIHIENLTLAGLPQHLARDTGLAMGREVRFSLT